MISISRTLSLAFAGLVVASAQCPLSQSAQAALAKVEQFANQPGYAFRKGEIYLDHGCFVEARNWFLKAKGSLPSEPDEREQSLNTINGAIEIIGAAEKYRAGKRDEAVADLRRVAQTYSLWKVLPRAAMALAQLIVADRDPQAWEAVRGPLTELADNGWYPWNAKLLLVEHQIVVAGPAQAIEDLTKELSHRQPELRRLQLQIFVAYALQRAGRSAEAAVLARNIEDDVGRSVLDYDLRLFYLDLCVNIWRQRAQLGTDATAAARLGTFQAALAEARSER